LLNSTINLMLFMSQHMHVPRKRGRKAIFSCSNVPKYLLVEPYTAVRDAAVRFFIAFLVVCASEGRQQRHHVLPPTRLPMTAVDFHGHRRRPSTTRTDLLPSDWPILPVRMRSRRIRRPGRGRQHQLRRRRVHAAARATTTMSNRSLPKMCRLHFQNIRLSVVVLFVNFRP